jgi:mono/diheme cytochrome c family protein
MGSATAFAGDPEAGKILWDEMPCQQCHGIDGTPTFPTVPKFIEGDRLDKPDGELLMTIINGTTYMPAFKGEISNAEALDLIAFIRTLEK